MSLKPPTELDMIDALVRLSNNVLAWYYAAGIPEPSYLRDADWKINSVQDALRIRLGLDDENGEPITCAPS